MNGDADSFLRSYAGSGVAVIEPSPGGEVVVETPATAAAEGESMPDTIPASPRKSGFWHGLFSKTSGLASAGGLGAALLVLIILYLAIVPVSSGGSTRLELLWATLRGKTVLNPQAPGPVKAVESFAQSALVGADSQIASIGLGIKTNVIDLEHWIGGL